MEYKIDNLNQMITASLITSQENGAAIVSINGKARSLKIINSVGNRLEFIFDNKYHIAKVTEDVSSYVRLVIDGRQISLKKHSNLAQILGKSSSRGQMGVSENSLSSQIPGRVVGIMVKEGQEVKKGESIAVVESMKMQIAIKAHKEGTIKDIKVKEGTTVARNDLIATIE